MTATVASLLRKPLRDIVSEMKSSDKHAGGLALEAVAFYLMRLIDLDYVMTRLRGEDTGGAQVDLIFEGSRLHFSRWQVQCRNTAWASVDDVAREVGLLDYFHSDVGVVVSVGQFDPAAIRFAEIVRRRSRQPLVLVDGRTLDAIAKDPAALLDTVRTQAPAALAMAEGRQ